MLLKGVPHVEVPVLKQRTLTEVAKIFDMMEKVIKQNKEVRKWKKKSLSSGLL